MVQLLDLPLEIVDEVIEWSILKTGLKKSIRLRLVSRLLNDRFMAAASSHDLYWAWYHVHWSKLSFPEYASSFSPFASRVLAYRLNFSPELSTDSEMLLHRVLEHLKITAVEYVAALQTLFENAAECVRQNTPCLLWHDYPLRSIGSVVEGPDEEGSFERHLLPAAILLGVEHFYDPVLISTVNTDTVNGDSILCGTPLFAAVKSRRHHLVRRILDLSDTADTRRNCLRGAAIVNDEAMLQLLLDHRSEPYDHHCLRETLDDAAQLGHAGIARAILSYIMRTQPDILNADFLALSVHFAARYGWINVLDVFHQHGADLQLGPRSNISRASPCMLAAWRGDTELLRWIIQRRYASGNWEGQGWNCISAAIHGDRPESLRILFEAGAAKPLSDWNEDNDLFMRCHLLRAVKAFRYLVLEARVVDLHPEGELEWLNLKYWMAAACKSGNAGMFEVLVDSGVSVDAPLDLTDPPGLWGGHPTWTPMHYAMASSERGAAGIVEKLQNMGVPKINLATESSSSDGFKPRMFPRETRRCSDMPRSLRAVFPAL